MQNFSLENHHMMNARQPFCWWMTFTKVSNPFLPSPHKWLTWPLDVCGGVGYGWFYWFSLSIFSQTSPELEIFLIPQVSSETSLPCWFKTSQTLRSVENKVEFLKRQCHSEKLSFVRKRKLSIILNFLFPLCLLSPYFQSWNAKL